MYYHHNRNASNNPPELHDVRNRTRDLSPVAESSVDYAMEQGRSRSLAYSDRDRYTSPALDYGYAREHGYPPRGDYDNRGHGFPPQHSGGYYNSEAYGRGYNRDSRWDAQDMRSPYHRNGPSSNSNTQLAEHPGNVPPSA